MRKDDCPSGLLLAAAAVLQDTSKFIGMGVRSITALMAETLSSRTQPALYLERKVMSRPARLTLHAR